MVSQQKRASKVRSGMSAICDIAARTNGRSCIISVVTGAELAFYEASDFDDEAVLRVLYRGALPTAPGKPVRLALDAVTRTLSVLCMLLTAFCVADAHDVADTDAMWQVLTVSENWDGFTLAHTRALAFADAPYACVLKPGYVAIAGRSEKLNKGWRLNYWCYWG